MKVSISYCRARPIPSGSAASSWLWLREDRQNAGHVIAGSRSGGEEGLDAGAQAFRSRTYGSFT